MKPCIVILLCLLVCACGGDYQQEDGHIVFVTANEGQGTVKTLVQGADIASFRDLGNYYAVDKNRAYRGSGAISGAHAASFVVIAPDYAKDDAQVYYSHKPIAHADPASFVVIDPNYARDRNDVYMQGEPMHVCDASSFHRVADELDSRNWAIDNQCAYVRGVRLPGAHPRSFRVLGYEYAKDDVQAYSSTFGVIRDADAATFEMPKSPCNICARDKYRCYSSGKPTPCNPRFFPQ
ncbi:MAG: DKNYY domain-containing protein [Rudaea sp.]|uniref:DKNYY domain-containing protein n=1 Tax=Rudaea sp. TaxID=2136325 RepID=UPI0039E5C148